MPLEDKLKLLLDIDRISDEAKDERSLALQLVAHLANVIEIDLIAFSLPDEHHPERWKLQAVTDRSEVLKLIGLDELKEIADQAAEMPAGSVIKETVPAGKNKPSVRVVGVPQNISGEVLGVLLLSKVGEEFNEEEMGLIEVATTRMDSALKHARTRDQLEREALALRTVLQVDRIRDTSHSLDDLLDRSLTEVTKVISAEAGFIMLYDRKGNRLELRALTGKEFFKAEETFQQLYDIADEAINAAETAHWQSSQEDLKAVLGVPLILNERVVGVLGVVNPTDNQDFTTYDRKLLEAIASQMDTAIFERMETQRLREVFGRNVGDKVMNRLLQISDRNLLRGERVEMTILFSDIRGFTGECAKNDAVLMEEMIDYHFEMMVAEIHRHEGTLDKFLGDGVMAFFNAPERQPDHAVLAVRTALAMQEAHKTVQRYWEENNMPVLPIGIGVASGEVVVGNFGSEIHAEYSVVGSVVNLAARLCEDAEGGEVLVNDKVYELVKGKFNIEEGSPRSLKGFGDPVPVWKVMGHK